MNDGGFCLGGLLSLGGGRGLGRGLPFRLGRGWGRGLLPGLGGGQVLEGELLLLGSRFLRGLLLERLFPGGGLFRRRLFHRFLIGGLRRQFLQRGAGIQHPLNGLFGDRLLAAYPLELHRVVEHVQLDLHGLVRGGLQHGLLYVRNVLLLPLAPLHADAVLAGVGVRGEGGDRHGGHHAELVGHLLLVHPGGLNGFRHPAAPLLLKPLEVLLHLVVDGFLGVVEQGLVGLLFAGQLPGGIVAHAVLVDGLELDAVVNVVFRLVKVGDPFLSAKQAAPLFLFLLPVLGLLRLRLRGRLGGLLPQGNLHRAGGEGIEVRLGFLLGRRRFLGRRSGRSRRLGRLRGNGFLGLGLPVLRSLQGRLLRRFQLPLGPLFRQNIFQGEFLVVLCHGMKILLLRIDRF